MPCCSASALSESISFPRFPTRAPEQRFAIGLTVPTACVAHGYLDLSHRHPDGGFEFAPEEFGPDVVGYLRVQIDVDPLACPEPGEPIRSPDDIRSQTGR